MYQENLLKIKEKIGFWIGTIFLMLLVYIVLQSNPFSKKSEPISNATEYNFNFKQFRKNISRNILGGKKLVRPVTRLDGYKIAPIYEKKFIPIEQFFFHLHLDQSSYIENHSVLKSVIFSDKKKQSKKMLGNLLDIKWIGTPTNLNIFHTEISQIDLYRKNDPLVDDIMNDMATLPIKRVSLFEGKFLNLLIEFKNGDKAIFKPMRYADKRGTLPEHFHFNDFDRHFGEIAAFHLDRLLGFRRTPPVVGRRLNISKEIFAKSSKALRKTFFNSPVSPDEKCFYGRCEMYCDIYHAFCGIDGILEGSMTATLPDFHGAERKKIHYPFRKMNKIGQLAKWQKNPDFCYKLQKLGEFKAEERFLNLVDLAIFDFLIGNHDRQNFEVFNIFDEKASIIHIDHGRSFGRPNYEDWDILEPLDQCCVIRKTTLQTLIRFHKGPKRLSDAMRKSLMKDPVAPILLEKHLLALDRRVARVLSTLYYCMQSLEKKMH